MLKSWENFSSCPQLFSRQAVGQESQAAHLIRRFWTSSAGLRAMTQPVPQLRLELEQQDGSGPIQIARLLAGLELRGNFPLCEDKFCKRLADRGASSRCLSRSGKVSGSPR